MTTINISISKGMYDDAKKMLAKKRYVSISELIRDALRKILYPNITENGFTPEFEKEILKSEAEPLDKDAIWETSEDIDRFFYKLHEKLEKRRHDKD